MFNNIKFCPLWPDGQSINKADGSYYECQNVQCKFQQNDKCAFLWTLALCFDDVETAAEQIAEQGGRYKN